MPADGPLADADLLGDLFVGGAARDPAQDVDLPPRQRPRRARGADLGGLDAELGIDVLRGRGVGHSEFVFAERLVRQRHPLVDLCGFVARLLGAVLAQRRLQGAECFRVAALPLQDSAPGMRRPCAEARRSNASAPDSISPQ